MDKPHVIEVVSNYPAQTFLMRHLSALAHLDDFEITVASKGPVSYEESSIQRTAQTHFPVVYLPDSRQPRAHQAYHVLRSLPYHHSDFPLLSLKSKALLRSFKNLQADLVHFQFGQLAIMLLPYVKALKIPYTVSLRGSEVQELPVSDTDFVEQLRAVLAGAAGIHTVCDSFGEDARTFLGLPLKTTTIRTCLPELVPCPDEKPSKLRFISVGRLHWRKAFDDLIRAMAYLPQAELEIIGGGPEDDHLRYVIHFHQLQDRVHLHGNLPFEQFREHLCGASAYVQSSIAEGFSNALAEAMMLGKAVFATAAGGTDEVIQNGVNGVILPIGDPRGIAEKLALAENPQFLATLGSAARDTAQVTFNMNSHANQFARFYQEALSSSKTASMVST